MILLDFSNIIVGSIMVAHKVPDEERFSEEFIRHLVLNSVRSYRKKYNSKYGEMVICTDHLSSWRKVAFPYYKAHRKVQREKQSKESGMDWTALFDTISRITCELKEYFPYKVIQVPHAEGDDVIAVLAKYANNTLKEPTLIVSSDKDFNQLYKYKTIRQFSPMKQKMLSGIDAVAYLKEHIIRGDKGDGIPNILSADDCLVSGVRQKPISKKKISTWLHQEPEDFCKNGMMSGWNRNQEVIDFEYIPPPMTLDILEQYNTQVTPNRSELLNYFVKHRLKMLIEHIGDF
jgi:5'-3' exonuclease|tara:strand:+ start:142 stop:1008 length:867 start_codon:yes stop_codon:yes gene_type:complete